MSQASTATDPPEHHSAQPPEHHATPPRAAARRDATSRGTTSRGTTSRAARIRARFRTRAPARPRPRALVAATVSSVAALAMLVAVGHVTHQVLLIPPLAASMALVAGAPGLPLAQPRNVIGGQLVSAVTGYAVLTAAGAVGAPGSGSMWSAAVAGGLALGAMLLCRCSHSPAAATAAIVAGTAPSALPFLPLLALASCLLVAVGLAAHRLNRQAYPAYWW